MRMAQQQLAQQSKALTKQQPIPNSRAKRQKLGTKNKTTSQSQSSSSDSTNHFSVKSRNVKREASSRSRRGVESARLGNIAR